MAAVREGAEAVPRLPGVEGVWVFIAADMCFFALLFVSFMLGRQEATTVFEASRQTLDINFGGINTLILLTSGTTITWAHHSMLLGDKRSVTFALVLTVLLGLLFTSVQAYEYSDAPFAFHNNIYGSTFFMATGFHGAHVLIGTIFLIVCYLRARRGDFTPQKHFGFEAAAWYWHFVDVVWLFLFVAVYLWGGWGDEWHG